MAIIFKQCFWYTCDIGAISENTWERVKINTKELKEFHQEHEDLEMHEIYEMVKSKNMTVKDVEKLIV